MPGVGPISHVYDQSAANAILDLLKNERAPISGEALMNAILVGTSDCDGAAASAEFLQVAMFVEASGNILSPEAKAVFDVYKHAAGEARAQGLAGMTQAQVDTMTAEMKKVAGGAGYADPRAGAEIAKLETILASGKDVTEQDLESAIVEAIGIHGNGAAGAKFDDFEEFARQNWDRLTPGARESFRIYEDWATALRAEGKTGGDPKPMLHDWAFRHMRE